MCVCNCVRVCMITRKLMVRPSLWAHSTQRAAPLRQQWRRLGRCSSPLNCLASSARSPFVPSTNQSVSVLLLLQRRRWLLLPLRASVESFGLGEGHLALVHVVEYDSLALALVTRCRRVHHDDLLGLALSLRACVRLAVARRRLTVLLVDRPMPLEREAIREANFADVASRGES